MTNFILALLGWTVLAPLSFLIRRKGGLWVVIGRDRGRFLDNCKYLYLAAQDDGDITTIFLSSHPDVVREISLAGGRALPISGIRGTLALLRAAVVFGDSIDWMRGWQFAATRGARRVQLWHGIPLKTIERPLWESRLRRSNFLLRGALKILATITGRYARPDVFLSTSDAMIDRAFARCVPAGSYISTGYPRNDVLRASEASYAPAVLIGVDRQAFEKTRRWKGDGGKVVLYAPTFRDDLKSPLRKDVFDSARAAEFARRTGALFLIKLHPWVRIDPSDVVCENLVIVKSETDIYPMLRDVDALITDYSSIFFDYLLLDRPVLFYPYDLDRYVEGERPLLFDYCDMTPGPHCFDFDTLLIAIETACTGIDDFAAERAKVRDLVHDHADDGAARRLIACIRRQS